MHEPVPSAWGSNSRPSSASGALTSNQTSLTPLRPQSAETRPGSSQLSRFAEHLPDNSASWASTGNVDKLVCSCNLVSTVRSFWKVYGSILRLMSPIIC